jgi:mRNA interferase RelE/StbE
METPRKAQRALDALPARDRQRISDAIAALSDEPRPPGVKKLAGGMGWRIRVGEYRVLYSIWDSEQHVLVDNVLRRTTHTYD